MSTRPQVNDERWHTIIKALVNRGLTYRDAEIAAHYVIECLDVQEARFDKEREPFG